MSGCLSIKKGRKGSIVDRFRLRQATSLKTHLRRLFQAVQGTKWPLKLRPSLCTVLRTYIRLRIIRLNCGVVGMHWRAASLL